MKSLSLKVLALLAPFVALSVPAFVQTIGMMVQAERSVTLRDGVFDVSLDGKWQALVTDETRVIVAGDSRAERQVMPSVIAARTGWRTANVATSAQDLVTLSNALKRHHPPAAARVLIVSVSMFQINDGAIDGGYLSTASLLNMTTWERARIYADRLGSPWSPLAFQFVDGPAAVVAPALLRQRGFVGSDKRLLLPLSKMLLNEHPWYRKISLHGARWRIFRHSLAQVAASGLRVYLFQPPVSPAWRAYTAGTFVDTAEREFAGMLRAETAGYVNVRFLDFYSAPDPRLGNGAYYDIQHLNVTGASAFTAMLIDRIDADPPAPAEQPASK